MKKNFVVATPTQQEYDALMQWSEANSITWAGGQSASSMACSHYWQEKDYRYIAFRTNNTMLRHNNDEVARGQHGPIVPFSTFAAIQGIELGPAPVELRVGEYGAIVDYQREVVQVGCQTIPFSKVKEVYQLTQQHVEQPDKQLVLTREEAISEVWNAACDYASSIMGEQIGSNWDKVNAVYKHTGLEQLLRGIGYRLTLIKNP